MPHMQAMVERANERFNRKNIGGVNPGLLAAGTALVDAARALEIATSTAEEQVLGSLPAGQQEALRATLLSAVQRGLPVQFAWAAGYDYEMTFWEAAGSSESLGGTTVLLRTRYPSDAHPLLPV